MNKRVKEVPEGDMPAIMKNVKTFLGSMEPFAFSQKIFAFKEIRIQLLKDLEREQRRLEENTCLLKESFELLK